MSETIEGWHVKFSYQSYSSSKLKENQLNTMGEKIGAIDRFVYVDINLGYGILCMHAYFDFCQKIWAC